VWFGDWGGEGRSPAGTGSPCDACDAWGPRPCADRPTPLAVMPVASGPAGDLGRHGTACLLASSPRRAAPACPAQSSPPLAPTRRAGAPGPAASRSLRSRAQLPNRCRAERLPDPLRQPAVHLLGASSAPRPATHAPAPGLLGPPPRCARMPAFPAALGAFPGWPLLARAGPLTHQTLLGPPDPQWNVTCPDGRRASLTGMTAFLTVGDVNTTFNSTNGSVVVNTTVINPYKPTPINVQQK
jgi:hypothetical protein